MKILYIAPVGDFSEKDSGYGNASASILYCLHKMKEEKKIDELIVINSLKPITIIDIECDIAMVAANPYSLLNPQTIQMFNILLSKSKKKYLTILWETMPLPSAWKVIWDSNLFDGYLAPSYFIGVQLKQIIDKPVYYHPYYIHVDKDNRIDLEQKKMEDIFSVLFIGQNTKRKGIDETIISFSRAFNDCKDAQLVIKYHNLSAVENNIENLIKEYSMANQSCKNAKIYTIESNLTADQLITLYKSSAVLLFPSRGEGFNLPGPEAMSVGLPVIYADWSASSEVCESPFNYPIKCRIDEAVNMFHHGYEIGSKYAYANIGDLIKALKECYSNWKKDKMQYYTNAYNNQEIIAERFSYKIVSDCLDHVFKEQKTFAPDYIFNTKHWDRNLEDYKKVIKGEV